MKIKELTPGLYKVRQQNRVPYGAKHSRMNANTVQLLRVEGVGDRCLYFLDHDTFGQHPSKIDSLENYEILSRYQGDPQINKCRITIAFSDASGQEFAFTVRDAWTLKGVFESIPWLKRPFGFLPRK